MRWGGTNIYKKPRISWGRMRSASNSLEKLGLKCTPQVAVNRVRPHQLFWANRGYMFKI